jgi:hypothetical protein
MQRDRPALAACTFPDAMLVARGCVRPKAGRRFEGLPLGQPGQHVNPRHEEATVAAEGPMMDVFNNLVMYPWSSWQRQGRRLIWIELHVESNEKCCCPSIIAHESDEIDQRALAELP